MMRKTHLQNRIRNTGTDLRFGGSRILFRVLFYVLLVELVFVFLYPLIYMAVNSLKDQQALLDLNADWILRSADYGNYRDAARELHYGASLRTSLLITVLSTIGHVISCSMIAYGLSRFRFPGKKLILAGILLTVLVPMQILEIPLYIQYARMGWIGTILPVVVPTFFGGGLRGGLFILIYYQFFRNIPKSFEEAARLEGCGSFDIYARILMPVARQATVVVATLSVIWHWTDHFESLAYLSGSTKTLMQRLSLFPAYLYANVTPEGITISPVEFAACLLTILPVILFVLLVQKRFVESAEESGQEL